MKRLMVVLCVISCLLSGCSGWLDGSYHSVTPHTDSNNPIDTENLSAGDYDTLLSILSRIIQSGVESSTISIPQYDQESIARDMEKAILFTMTYDPIAAYAAEAITYELGTSAGQPAVAVTVKYIHDRSELKNIITVPSVAMAKDAVANALNQCKSGVVLYINGYSPTDFEQWVDDYASEHPDKVMECPSVSATLYPATGVDRVLELKFTYQTSTESLKNMQQTLAPVFDAAILYVSGNSETAQKFSQLYSFLMERHDYQLHSSITPAYSLLHHGVGNSEAFANVYGAMCRKSNLECITISGTKDGQAWYWNIINIEGNYYHVDLLQCKQDGVFRPVHANDMTGYVWDYSAAPIDLTP